MPVFVYVSAMLGGSFLELRTGCNQCLACLVGRVLVKVLDEAGCEVFSLNFPLSSVFVRVTRIEDSRIYARQSGRNLEVEERNLLRRSGENVAAEDRIDDTTGIADRDTFARSVPTGVNEVCFRAGFLHSLNQLLCVFGRVELQECLAEASGEGRSRLGDTALGACQLGGEAAEEVILGLLGSQDGNRRQHAEGVGRKEYHVLGLGTGALAVDLLGNLLDVLDGIAYAGILGDALVCEIDLALGIYGHVFQQSIAADSVIDVRLVLLAQVEPWRSSRPRS